MTQAFDPQVAAKLTKIFKMFAADNEIQLHLAAGRMRAILKSSHLHPDVFVFADS